MSKDNSTHPSPASSRTLILGSSSRYRKELLSRLNIPFEVAAPEVDETPHINETPRDLALRLALAKARAVASKNPEAVVIGSDQVADLEGQPLGKPGNHDSLWILAGNRPCFGQCQTQRQISGRFVAQGGFVHLRGCNLKGNFQAGEQFLAIARTGTQDQCAT